MVAGGRRVDARATTHRSHDRSCNRIRISDSSGLQQVEKHQPLSSKQLLESIELHCQHTTSRVTANALHCIESTCGRTYTSVLGILWPGRTGGIEESIDRCSGGSSKGSGQGWSYGVTTNDPKRSDVDALNDKETFVSRLERIEPQKRIEGPRLRPLDLWHQQLLVLTCHNLEADILI